MRSTKKEDAKMLRIIKQGEKIEIEGAKKMARSTPEQYRAMIRDFKKEDAEIKKGKQTVRSIGEIIALLEQLSKASLLVHTVEGLCVDATVSGTRRIRDRAELLVSPQAGEGSAWVSLDRISLKGVV
jgi:hypothetical protein